MLREYPSTSISDFLNYLAKYSREDGNLPSLSELSQHLGLSIATLREQLEVARALGLVEVKPRTGVRRKPYSFTPAVRQSLRYAIALQDDHFKLFTDLRNHVETAYWEEAVRSLTTEDKQILGGIVDRAWEKLRGSPVQVPHAEHRQFHLLIYKRINNPFVTGILEAYWDAYEVVGLNFYTGGLDYLEEVWDFHTQMKDAILSGDLERGRNSLIKHVDLLAHRPG
jgi:DNA-binding FadR family transcriptional regulator